MLKRLFLFSVLLCGAYFTTSAQYLDATTLMSHKVITLTIKNLKTIVDCTSNQFASLMQNYGYWPSRDIQASDYTHQIYENNSLDLYLDGNNGLGANYIEMSETYKHAQIFGNLSTVYPRNALINLRNSLQPYYHDRTTDGIERFVIEDGKGGGYLIQIVTPNNTQYNVHIQHFPTLH